MKRKLSGERRVIRHSARFSADAIIVTETDRYPMNRIELSKLDRAAELRQQFRMPDFTRSGLQIFGDLVIVAGYAQ